MADVKHFNGKILTPEFVSRLENGLYGWEQTNENTKRIPTNNVDFKRTATNCWGIGAFSEEEKMDF